MSKCVSYIRRRGELYITNNVIYVSVCFEVVEY